MENIANGFTALIAVIVVLGISFVAVAGTVGLAVVLVLAHKASKHKRVLYGAAAIGAGALAYRYAPNIAHAAVNKYNDIRDAVQDDTVRVNPDTGEVFDDPRDRVRFQ